MTYASDMTKYEVAGLNPIYDLAEEQRLKATQIANDVIQENIDTTLSPWDIAFKAALRTIEIVDNEFVGGSHE